MLKVLCINSKPLDGNDVAPPLETGKEYLVKQVIQDRKGFSHYDVGLISKYNYITSVETGEQLPNSGQGGVHWCHPCRFMVGVAKTEESVIADALRMKKGRRLLTQELTIIGLMWDDENYTMYVNEGGAISFKRKETPNDAS